MPAWSLALEWLHGMRPLTLPPDVFCFSSSLTSLKRDSYWRSATQVLQSIQDGDFGTVSLLSFVLAVMKNSVQDVAVTLLKK